MIDIKRLRQDPDGTRAALARRQDPSAIATLDRILDLDRQRRELLVRAESAQGRAERRHGGSGEAEARRHAGR